MSLLETTARYETWLGAQLPIVRADLALKHARMKEGAFPFLRATFYRWVELWDEALPDLARTPKLLAIGDLHVENFGTWRDAEGRLVWGANDFDEAARMPYAIDLVRLATSALVARDENHLTIGADAACQAILDGYVKTIATGGKAFVLEESHPKLRALALGAERDPVRYWAKFEGLRTARAVPGKVNGLLKDAMPSPKLKFRVGHRVAGLGSLGRPRYVALARWSGGMVAREAKALLPSAYGWARGKPKRKLYYEAIMGRAVRALDPFVTAHGPWLLRRLAPHCSRIELADLPARRDERLLLEAMGRETANVHLGSPEAVSAIRADLRRRKPTWLAEAAAVMAQATSRDWRSWRARR